MPPAAYYLPGLDSAKRQACLNARLLFMSRLVLIAGLFLILFYQGSHFLACKAYGFHHKIM